MSWRGARARANTVHLRVNSWYPLWEEDTRKGAHFCRSFYWHPDHGLHQLGCGDEVHSLKHGEVCSSVCPEVEPTRASLASACCKRRSKNRPRHPVRAGDAAEEN